MTLQSFLSQFTFGSATSLATIQQQTGKAPVANSNFLKRVILSGSQRTGLFDAIGKAGAAP